VNASLCKQSKIEHQELLLIVRATFAATAAVVAGSPWEAGIQAGGHPYQAVHSCQEVGHQEAYQAWHLGSPSAAVR
jgi:hypothetical protein